MIRNAQERSQASLKSLASLLPYSKRLWLLLASFLVTAASPGGPRSLTHLGSRVGPAVVTASPLGAANEHTPPCGVSSPQGSDMAYLWTAPATGAYVFTTQARDFDTTLSIYDSTGAVLGCNADKSSALVVDMAANAVVRIIVDVASRPPNEQSSFTLNICSPVLCNAPPGSKECFQAGTCAFNGACRYSPKPAGTPCDDQDEGTLLDLCHASGTCVGIVSPEPPPRCPSGSQLCNDTCVSMSDINNCGSCGNVCNRSPGECYDSLCSNGTCEYPPKSKNTACNDGLASTINDTCDGAGSCRGDIPCTEDGTRCWNSGSRSVCRNGILVPESCGTGSRCVSNNRCQLACSDDERPCGDRCCGPGSLCCRHPRTGRYYCGDPSDHCRLPGN
jgi:hypothetical protein